ncbi:RrF2 family transcriptional regulator [Paenibacillus solisilvae]|uniref:RrF2 family transcriptional regulator n=1 Tax=Paenibacillus solisilvae TaxID=2486751 RepID=A0ABW0VX83_9BACL
MANRVVPIGPPRFEIAIRALVWLTQSSGVLTSAALAAQVHSHATFIRRVLQNLAQAGLVESKEGRDGGYLLGKSACQITLADIYIAVQSDCPSEADSTDACAGQHQKLDDAIGNILMDVEQKTLEYLRQFTIDDVREQVGFSAEKI